MVRRSPEQARAHLLDAADRVFLNSLPDAVGLREIAKEAHVSHGLITHYFGSYDGLITAVIARRIDAARANAFEKLASLTFAPADSPLLVILIELLADRTLTRLIAWSFLSGRKVVIGPAGQLSRLLDGMAARWAATTGHPIDRQRLELSAMVAISTVTGWAIAAAEMEHALSREPLSRDELLRELQRMIHGYLVMP
jgi:TetR/AcrR family transcriptional regulator, repressor for neighboring sulfatase